MTTATLTIHEEAVRHILRRIVDDVNMTATESLRLCVLAEAERAGKTEEDVERRLWLAIEQRLERKPAEPEVVVLRKELEELRGAQTPEVEDVCVHDGDAPYERLWALEDWLHQAECFGRMDRGLIEELRELLE
jgi:hypothetical protein